MLEPRLRGGFDNSIKPSGNYQTASERDRHRSDCIGWTLASPRIDCFDDRSVDQIMDQEKTIRNVAQPTHTGRQFQ